MAATLLCSGEETGANNRKEKRLREWMGNTGEGLAPKGGISGPLKLTAFRALLAGYAPFAFIDFSSLSQTDTHIR